MKTKIIEDKLFKKLPALESQLDSIEIINVSSFGAKGDCVEGDWVTMPTGTDDTNAIQQAFDFASTNGKKLIFEKFKKYLITDTLIFNKPCDIDFNGAIFIPFIKTYYKPTILCSSQVRRTWKNLTIDGRGMIPNGINFTKPDNQAMTLENIKITTCRQGVYLGEGECVNRIIFKNCDFGSNLISGIYFKSYNDGGTFSQSGPVHFKNVICNSNGIPRWIANSPTTTYNGVNVLNNEKIGYQVYLKGFVNVNWKGGQISNHGDARNISMAQFENINGISIDGDLEDITSLTDLNGEVVTDFTGVSEDVGNCVYFKSCLGVKTYFTSCYNLQAKTIVGMRYCDKEHFIEISSDYTPLYHLALFNPTINSKIFFNGDVKKVNKDGILKMVNNVETLKSIRCSAFTTSNISTTSFDNVNVSNGHFVTTPYDVNNLETNNYFNLNFIDDVNSILIKSLVNSNSFTPKGIIFIVYYDINGNYISDEQIPTRGNAKYNNFYNVDYLSKKPLNAFRCKIGFAMSDSTTGNIETSCNRIKKFEIILVGNVY